MDTFGIAMHGGRGTSLYRAGGVAEWDLAEAAEIAQGLLDGGRGEYVTVGNSEHEFRLLPDNEGDRHAEWYVDVEVGDRRWRYRPLADISDYEAADELAASAANDLPDITRVWIGRSDGGEEYDTPANDG